MRLPLLGFQISPMTFLINPFASKRRNIPEEVDVGSPDGCHLAPDTPPNAGEHLLGAALPTPPQDETPTSASPEDRTFKARSRAKYFESLIRSRTSNTSSAGSPVKQLSSNDMASLERVSTPPLEDHAAQPAGHIPSSDRLEHPQRPLALGGLTAAAAADALENLRLELSRVESERRAAVEALRRRTQEVENLQTVVKELSESRSSAIHSRCTIAEQYVDLQRAHERVSRVADLSRIVSKENLELTKAARGIAQEATRKANDAQREASAATKAERRASKENSRLRDKVGYLERMDLDEHTESVCKREFVGARVMETY